MRIATIMAAMTSAIVAAGCATTQSAARTTDVDIIQASHQAAQALAGQAQLAPGAPIIVASLADINALDRSTPFGRIVSQQIATAISAQGYEVFELLLRNNIYIKSGEGEFVLSRKIQNISREHNVRAILAGVYAIGKEHVYVTVKLIRAADSVVLAAFDFRVPLGPDVRQLLGMGAHTSDTTPAW